MTKTLLTALILVSISTSALAQKIQEPIYFGLATRGYSYPAKHSAKTTKPVTVTTQSKKIKEPLYFRFAKGN